VDAIQNMAIGLTNDVLDLYRSSVINYHLVNFFIGIDVVTFIGFFPTILFIKYKKVFPYTLIFVIFSLLMFQFFSSEIFLRDASINWFFGECLLFLMWLRC